MIDSIFREYLGWTDWYAIRENETGQNIPTKVLLRRAYCRKMIESERVYTVDFDIVFKEPDAHYKKLMEAKKPSPLENEPIEAPSEIPEEKSL